MKQPGLRDYAIGASMVAATLIAIAMIPSAAGIDTPRANLEQLLPQQFGAWKTVPSAHALASLTTNARDNNAAQIYDQTVMRTYQRSDGSFVMLAVAWVQRQSQDVKVHRPELCYTAQGFQVVAKETAVAPIGSRNIPMTRLVTRNPQHVEPVTYWIRLGDHFSSGPLETRLTILKEGLLGNVPDGILVRVSTISRGEQNLDAEFITQQTFLKELLDNLDHDGKRLMVGHDTNAFRRMGGAERNPSSFSNEQKPMGYAALHPSYAPL